MQNDMPMEELVIHLLKVKLPPNYYYHDYQHTLYVIQKAIEIGRHENCTEKEIHLLSTAALWHDTGYLTTYAGHEEESCRLAKKYLPLYAFAADDIDTICGMIMATKVPQLPQNKLEQILADADLEYLGTANAAATAHNLFKELQSLDPQLTEASWRKLQVSFLQSHHYFTAYCQQNKEPLKSAYLNQLINAG